VTPGVHVPHGADELDRLRAWALILPSGAAFTGLTAAAVRRWWLPPLPPDLPVFAEQSRLQPRPRRQGLHVTRTATPPVTEWWYGLDLVPAPQILLGCARVVSLLDLVVLIDGALATGASSLAELGRLLESSRPRPGMPLLRSALELADARSESPWETLLRVMHTSSGIVVEPQAELRLDGVLVRGDLWLVGTRTLHEYDGEHHRTIDGHRADLRRERRLLGEKWSRRGYTSVDLLRKPERTCARPTTRSAAGTTRAAWNRGGTCSPRASSPPQEGSPSGRASVWARLTAVSGVSLAAEWSLEARGTSARTPSGATSRTSP